MQDLNVVVILYLYCQPSSCVSLTGHNLVGALWTWHVWVWAFGHTHTRPAHTHALLRTGEEHGIFGVEEGRRWLVAGGQWEDLGTLGAPC